MCHDPLPFSIRKHFSQNFYPIFYLKNNLSWPSLFGQSHTKSSRNVTVLAFMEGNFRYKRFWVDSHRFPSSLFFSYEFHPWSHLLCAHSEKYKSDAFCEPKWSSQVQSDAKEANAASEWQIWWSKIAQELFLTLQKSNTSTSHEKKHSLFKESWRNLRCYYSYFWCVTTRFFVN